MNPAILALEDGTVFEGRSFGAPAERGGEVVFNTAITGYQEIFTDPSYTGQIVILTNPQIGNYGTAVADNEAAKPAIEGLVVREFSQVTSNWRSDTEANSFLSRAGIPIVSDLDTRTLVRHRTPGPHCHEPSCHRRSSWFNSKRGASMNPPVASSEGDVSSKTMARELGRPSLRSVSTGNGN